MTLEKEGRWTFPTLQSLPPPPPFQNIPKRYPSGGVGGFIDPPEGGPPKTVTVTQDQEARFVFFIQIHFFLLI